MISQSHIKPRSSRRVTMSSPLTEDSLSRLAGQMQSQSLKTDIPSHNFRKLSRPRKTALTMKILAKDRNQSKKASSMMKRKGQAAVFHGECTSCMQAKPAGPCWSLSLASSLQSLWLFESSTSTGSSGGWTMASGSRHRPTCWAMAYLRWQKR